jgi:hypothetical protein
VKSNPRIADFVFVAATLVALLLAAQRVCAQATEASDPFDRITSTFQLDQQTMFEAIARLNESTGIVVSVERVLGTEGEGPVDPKFTATIGGGKPASILDEICDLDGQYSWARDGNVVNIFPRRSVKDRAYLFNRKIPVLKLKDAADAPSAAIDAVHALSGPPAQLIVLILGNLDFEKPWTTTIGDLSLRQAINRIAEHLCVTCGWQLSGTDTTPTIVFYRRLQASPPMAQLLLPASPK